MADISDQMLAYDGEGSAIQAYLVKPAQEGPRPAVIVVHEILGLNEQIKRLARRFAAEGYVAFAPNLFSRPELAQVLIPDHIEETMGFMMSVSGGRRADPATIQQALSQLPEEKRERIQKTLPVLFGGISREKATQDLVHAVTYLSQQGFVQQGKIGSVGFCFGGGLSINLACHAPLAAAVVFYGDNPNPIELVEKIPCPILGLYGANDERINAGIDKLVTAAVTYKKDFEMKIYTGAGHAFFNEDSPHTYNEAAAKDAWERVLRLYQRTLLTS